MEKDSISANHADAPANPGLNASYDHKNRRDGEIDDDAKHHKDAVRRIIDMDVDKEKSATKTPQKPTGLLGG